MPESTDVAGRPSPTDARRARMRALRGDVPIVFGGEVADDTLCITDLFGTRTGGLRGLRVPARFGLGGRVIASQQPAAVDNYKLCTSITHDFDRPVLGEGLTSVVAAPVVVDGRTRAVLYGAARRGVTLGDRARSHVAATARRIATDLLVSDEVDRRWREIVAAVPGVADNEVRATQQLRDVHTRLVTLAVQAPDASTQAALRELCDELTPQLGEPDPSRPRLTRRELEVLALVAPGHPNAEVARRLGLRTETVKTYVRIIAGKLGAHSRFEAVVAARRWGLLP